MEPDKTLNDELIKKASAWLDEKGKNEINKVTQEDNEIDSYIKSMSNVDKEQLKVPYNIF
jgi:hypothetical protein